MSPTQKLVTLAVLLALGQPAIAAVGNPAATQRALAYIASNQAVTGSSAQDSFAVRDVIVDRNGDEHVRMDRFHRGLPVLGGDLVVHSKASRFAGASLTMKTPVRLSTTTPTLTAAQAASRARSAFGMAPTQTPATPTLSIYARKGLPRLAYETVLFGSKADQTPTRMHYVIDARTGAVLSKWDEIETARPPTGGTGTPAVGTGQSLLSGNMSLNTTLNARHLYELKDSTRGGMFVMDYANSFRDEIAFRAVDGNNAWGNGSTTDRNTVAVDAQYGASATWDYFKDTFGRLGAANDNRGAQNNIHYLQNYSNAFWADDCLGTGVYNPCMTFGDGDGLNVYPFVVLDVTGHEMSHGVTSQTAGLVYEGASGALNEATSDIFGTMVEYHADNAQNPPNYTIGEKLLVDNPGMLSALRYMFKPSLDTISPDCYPKDDPDYEDFFNNYMDVHFSSGVANHFYYLLAEGVKLPAAGYELTKPDLVCNGNTTLAGIGRDAAQRIWYRALTVYMTSDTNYAGARVATLAAAADLFGAGSAQYTAVAASWDAVDVIAPARRVMAPGRPRL